jgi:hypothetical protein
MPKVFPKDDSGSQQPPKNPTRPWWDVLFGSSVLTIEKSPGGWRGKVQASGLVILLLAMLFLVADKLSR